MQLASAKTISDLSERLRKNTAAEDLRAQLEASVRANEQLRQQLETSNRRTEQLAAALQSQAQNRYA